MPLAFPALLVGANLPDVDVLAYVKGADFALGFRRGWTHGVLAMAVLPLLLTGLLLAWDRWVRRRRRPHLPQARAQSLLLLSYIGVLSHPLLDWLNVYGIRLLMPFDRSWFYGDILFIVDLWLWLILGVAAFLAAKRTQPCLATYGLLLACAYILFMAAGSRVARAKVIDEFTDRDTQVGVAADQLIVAPVPVTPFRHQVVAVSGDQLYRAGFHWFGEPRLEIDGTPIPLPPPDPAVAEALDAPSVSGFVEWARFPYYEVDRTPDGSTVWMIDARYARGRTEGFGGAVVELSPAR